MKLSEISLLECVDCHGTLSLHHEILDQDIIQSGLLVCDTCERSYPIIEEVGIFFRKEDAASYISPWERLQIERLGLDQSLAGISLDHGMASDQRKVAEAWEYQHRNVLRWEEFTDGEQYHSSTMFRRFILLDPEDYEGKTVHTACVGRGKEAHYVLSFGAKTALVSEIGEEAHDIPRILQSVRDRLVVVRADIKYTPFRDGVADIALCDHALQHVENHKLGYESLSRTAKAGGFVALCVYSHENNFLMTKIVEPSKAILKHLPLRLIEYLALPPTILIFAAIWGIYVPIHRTGIKALRKLPLFDHMIFWSGSKFKFIWTACFDLMHAPISHHFTKQEVENLAIDCNQTIRKLKNTHGTMWSIVAQKKPS